MGLGVVGWGFLPSVCMTPDKKEENHAVVFSK